MSLGADIHEVL